MIAALNARLAADRVDRLRPEEQLTLKVASVLGLTVYSQLLQVHIWETHTCMVVFVGLLQAQSGWLVLAAKNEETACPTNCPHAPCLCCAVPPLQATHPQHPPAAAVDASLCCLEAASFLRQDPQEPATWRFCQLLARDVVYEMIPKDVRRDWHAAAAAAMEAYSSGDLVGSVCELAKHDAAGD